jgi:hypothetical protein
MTPLSVMAGAIQAPAFRFTNHDGHHNRRNGGQSTAPVAGS